MPIGKLEKRMNSTFRTGVIKLGYKKESSKSPGKFYPTETAYFVIDPDKNPELIRQYGDKPTKLDIVFTSDDEEDIAKAYLTSYKCVNPNEQDPTKRKNYLACIGKGLDPRTDEPTLAFYYDVNTSDAPNLLPMTPELREQLEREVAEFNNLLQNPNMMLSSRNQIVKEISGRLSILKGDGAVRPRMCHHMGCPDFAAGKCKGVMTLSFKVPVGSVFGEYVIQTGSTVSMQNILNCIKDVKENIKLFYPEMPFGKISGIPLTLTRFRKQIKFVNPSTGKQEFSEHFPLKLEVNPTFKERFQQVLAQQIKSIMLEAPVSTKMLPAPNMPGAAVIDLECPDDLFPTDEEKDLAVIEKAAEAIEAEVQVPAEELSAREEWVNDPEIKALLDAWETKLGRLFPEGKRRAFVKTFATREEVIQSVKEKV